MTDSDTDEKKLNREEKQNHSNVCPNHTTTQAVGTETRHYETHDWAKVRGSYEFSQTTTH